MKGEFRRILAVGIVSVLGLTSGPGAGPTYKRSFTNSRVAT